MPQDFEDDAIRDRIHTISRQIDAILRKVATREPALLSDSKSRPAPESTPQPQTDAFRDDPPPPEPPPRPNPSASGTGKAPD
jgi:hypothetical protein